MASDGTLVLVGVVAGPKEQQMKPYFEIHHGLSVWEKNHLFLDVKLILITVLTIDVIISVLLLPLPLSSIA